MHFTKKTADITNAQPHAVLKEYELDFVPNDYFIGMLKKYGLYERPILDKNGNVITHYADIMGARANGVKQLEVYEVDMDEQELTLFILSKHTYNIKKVKRSFQIAVFYRDYLKTNTEGIKLAKTIKGNINKKIAHLMDTSESTVRRLLYVGQSQKAEQHFNMVEEGEFSLHYVRGLVNEERNTNPTPSDEGDYGEKDSGNHDSNDNENNDNTDEHYKPEEGDEESDTGTKGTKKIPKLIRLAPDKPIQFQDNCMKVNDSSISYGFDEHGSPFIEVDGERLEDIHLSEIIHRDSQTNGRVKSIILTQKAVNGVSIQITIENFGKAAKTKAA